MKINSLQFHPGCLSRLSADLAKAANHVIYVQSQLETKRITEKQAAMRIAKILEKFQVTECAKLKPKPSKVRHFKSDSGLEWTWDGHRMTMFHKGRAADSCFETPDQLVKCLDVEEVTA